MGNTSSTATAITWSWTGPNSFTSNLQNPTIVSPTPNDIYTLVVTINGCSSTTTVTIPAFNPIPQVTTEDIEVCEGEDINFEETGGSGTNWAWTGSGSTIIIATTQNFTIPNASSSDMGIYIVEVTDNNGCTDTSNVTVTVHPTPLVSAGGNSPVCLGDDLFLTGTFTSSGTNAPATTNPWSWTGPNNFMSNLQNPTVPSVTSAAAGTYTLVFTDNFGCTAASDRLIEVSEPIVTLTVDTDNLCFEDPLGFTFTGTPAPLTVTGDMGTFTPLIGLIDNGNGTATLSTLTAGAGMHIVTYTYKNAQGCMASATDTVEIFALPTVAPVDTSVCLGSTINIDGVPTGGSGVYNLHTWTLASAGTTGATSTNLTVANTQIATFDATGLTVGTVTLNYLVTDDNNCTMEGAVIVEIHENPTVAPVDTINVCAEDQITIDGVPSGGSGTYTTHAWTITSAGTTGATSTNLTVANAQIATFDAVGLASGTAMLEYTVTDGNGCTAIDTVTVIVDSLPASLSLDGVCSADLMSYDVGVQMGTHDTIVSVSPGILTLVGTDVNGLDSFLVSGIPSGTTLSIMLRDTLTGCVATDTIMINCICPAPPMLSNDTTICTLDSIPTLTAMVGTNQTACWLDNTTGDTLALNTLTYTPTATGVFAVVAKDTVTNCISDTSRVAMVFNPLPSLVVLDTACANDLSEYTILFSNTGGTNDTIIVSRGVLDTVGVDSFVVRQILDDSTVVITVLDTLTGCMNSVTITNNCSCINTLIAPVAAMDTLGICPGDS